MDDKANPRQKKKTYFTYDKAYLAQFKVTVRTCFVHKLM